MKLLILVSVMALGLAIPKADEGRRSKGGAATNAELEARVARQFALPSESGLLVTWMARGGAAQEAGVIPGDILTHYDKDSLRTIDGLRRASRRPGSDKSLLRLSRIGEHRTLFVKRGTLGVVTVAVSKGKANKRVADTGDALAADRLKPFDGWFTVEQSGQRSGLQRVSLAQSGGEIQLDQQLRFRDGKEDVDLRVRVDLEQAAELPLRLLAMATPDQLLLELRGSGGLLFGGVPTEAGVSPIAVTPPKRLIPSWGLVLTALAMPRRVGACRHLSLFEEGEAAILGYYSLQCVKQEPVTVGGKATPAYRYDASRFGVTSARYWVTADHRLVKQEFRGLTGVRTSEDGAAKGLPAGLSASLPKPFAEMPSLKFPGAERPGAEGG